MKISRAWSAWYRRRCPAISRSRFDLPHSVSPKTRKWASAPKSSSTGARVLSSSPRGTWCRSRPRAARAAGSTPAAAGPAARAARPRHRDGAASSATPSARLSARGLGVDARQRGQEVQAVAGDAAAGRRSGTSARPAVDLGLVRVAQAQLQPGAEQVADGGPELRPLAGRGQHVHAVAEAPGRDGRDRRLEVLVVLAQREPAVDDQEHVAVAVVGDLAARRIRRYAAIDSMPGSANSCSRSGEQRSAPRPRCAGPGSASSRVATPPTCGSRLSPASDPPPKSSSRTAPPAGCAAVPAS